MRKHRSLLMMDKRTTLFWSPRINTQVTWAMESATTSLSLQPSAWRWALTYWWTLGLCFALVTFTRIGLHLLTVEKVLWHTNGARISCGSMERRPGCTLELHHPGGLHVLHMGLDRPIQGTGTESNNNNVNYKGCTISHYISYCYFHVTRICSWYKCIIVLWLWFFLWYNDEQISFTFEDLSDLNLWLFPCRWDSRVQLIMKALFGLERRSFQR